MLEQELGSAALRSSTSTRPGCRFLAQVHRASLRSGRQVVLKVQCPSLTACSGLIWM